MHGLKHRQFLLAACCVAVFCAACGKNDNVEVYPVKGIVKFNGKPMAGGGSIVFIPTSNQVGKSPGGTVNPDGTYELTTYSEEGADGSMTGDFRVLITQTVYEEPPITEDSDQSGTVAESVEVVQEADRIPLIYSDPVSSPLTAKVEAKELNTIDFDLKPQ